MRRNLPWTLSVPVLFLLSVSCAVSMMTSQTVAAEKERLARKDSFLGVHFDFHAGPDCTEVGKNTTPEMIEKIIQEIKPDYIQIDCKGHRGMSSYPTKVGYPAPGIIGDPLKTWRDVTAKNGVALYMHYSGVLDMEAVMKNPDWAVTGPDGVMFDASDHMKGATSVFGPYVDKLLIPQLNELAGDYKVDGVWIDGECWGTTTDYGDKAVELFKKLTGAKEVPKGPNDPLWREWLDFHREAFRNYMKHYIAEVKKENPQFQICGNWAFTDLMPEKVTIPVDFLSGDYSPQDSVNSARLSARYLDSQGGAWDLMAWTFTTVSDEKGRNFKTADQLKREAAIVLAQGGGFQAYITQNRDGSVNLEKIPPMAETAKFCRERQKFTHKSETVPQIAVLFSTDALYKKTNRVFAPVWDTSLSGVKGTLNALLNSQYSVDLLSECHLTGRMKDYPLIVVPEWEYISPDFVKELCEYVTQGGSLLVIGERTGELFASDITNGKKNGSVIELGKGKIALAPDYLGTSYAGTKSKETREHLQKIVQVLFPAPLAEVTGSEFVDVSLRKLDGKLLVNLVNTSGPHDDNGHPIIDAIEPIGKLSVSIRCDKKPTKIIREPAGTPC
ncbi:MAG: hypothetical protein ACRC2T_03215, partial [Thermoguttaceae bacterium]